MDPTATDTQAQHPPRAKGSLRIDEAIGALTVAVIFLISIGNVLVRYFTNQSFAFTEEFSVWLLVVMTFIGSSVAFAVDEQIRIRFFIAKLPPAGQRAAEAFSMVCTTIVFALIIYYGGMFTYDEWYWGESSPAMGYPTWIYTIWLPLLSIVVLLRLWVWGWRRLRHAKREGSGPNEGLPPKPPGDGADKGT
jgi:TRAP-type C4-dicarboxylate transport system permease small subunit